MACKREVAKKKCRVAGGQPTWNETKGVCECMAIKTDAKGNKIQRMKKGKRHLIYLVILHMKRKVIL